MNLELSDDQVEMVAVVHRMFEQHPAAGTPFERSAWAELAQLGVFGLINAPAGADLGAVEAVLIAEEFGAALVPGPLIWSDLAADAVPGVSEGEVVVTGMFGRQSQATHVPHSDLLVVLDPSGAEVLKTADVTWQHGYTVDPTVPVSRVLDRGSGTFVADAREVGTWLSGARLLAASQMVGVARRATELSVDYASTRRQFGRAIGSFQSLKHLLADAHTSTELARSQVLVAAVERSEGADDTGVDATTALIVAERAALSATRTAIQVHGGMGYASESPCHLLYKRVLMLQSEFGGTHRLVHERLSTRTRRQGGAEINAPRE